MARFAFRLQLRPDQTAAYDEAHRQVWPELLKLLKDVGIQQYSIFRRGVDLFLYMQVNDFERAWAEIDRSPINQLWQNEMEPLLEPANELRPGERFPMMCEVFYLE